MTQIFTFTIPLFKAVYIAAGGVRLSRVIKTRDSHQVIVLLNLVHTN